MSGSPALGYAVLLSVPIGVGVVLAFAQSTGRVSPLAVAAGGLAGLAVFVLVLLGARGPAVGDGDRKHDP